MAEQAARARRIAQSIQDWTAFAGLMGLFLLGPATPHLLEHWRAETFGVLHEGPIHFADHAAYSLEIQNNGRLPERNVEIWAPLPPGGDVRMAASPSEFYASRPLQPRDVEGYRVFNIGDLNPGERYAVGVDVSWRPSADPQRGYADMPWVMARVVSAQRTAVPLGWRFRAFRAEMSLRWYRGAFTLMCAAVVLLLILLFRAGWQSGQPAAAKIPLPKEAWRRPLPVP